MGRYNYTNALNRLTAWAVKEGYTIEFDHNDISYIAWENDTLNSPNAIKIQGNYSIEMRVYILLHELGHHQLRKDWVQFTKILPFSANAEEIHLVYNDTKLKRRVAYGVSCVEEEFKAWDEGYKLAGKLGIRINEVKWHDFKVKCLLGYMRYYANKKT